MLTPIFGFGSKGFTEMLKFLQQVSRMRLENNSGLYPSSKIVAYLLATTVLQKSCSKVLRSSGNKSTRFENIFTDK